MATRPATAERSEDAEGPPGGDVSPTTSRDGSRPSSVGGEVEPGPSGAILGAADAFPCTENVAASERLGSRASSARILTSPRKEAAGGDHRRTPESGSSVAPTGPATNS